MVLRTRPTAQHWQVLRPPRFRGCWACMKTVYRSYLMVRAWWSLGVILANRLTFSDHMTHSTQRTLGRLRSLYRYILPEDVTFKLPQNVGFFSVLLKLCIALLQMETSSRKRALKSFKTCRALLYVSFLFGVTMIT